MSILLSIAAFFFYQEIPFKPEHEFEVKLDYQFKPRPIADHNTVNLGDVRKISTTAGGVLPYLALDIRLLALPAEKSRVIITTNLAERAITKKVDLSSILELELGFTDDMIDRVTAHQYTLTFVDGNKHPVNRILITVDEDGSFYVNGELRGKF